MRTLLGVVIVAGIGGFVGWVIGEDAGSIDSPDVKSAHVAAFDKAPQGTMALASFDAGWLIEQTVENNWGMFEAKDPDALKEKLSKAAKRYLGVDVMAAQSGLLWVVPMLKAAVLRIEGNFEGALKGKRTKEYKGVTMVKMHSEPWAAIVDGALVVGTRTGVKLAIDLAKGDVKSLAEDNTAVEHHKKALAAIDDGPVVITGHLGAFSAMLGPAAGIEAAAVAFDLDRYSAAITGQEKTLQSLMNLYEDGQEKAKEALRNLLANAKEDEVGELVLLLILAEHKLDELSGLAGIKHEGDRITAKGTGAGPLVAAYASVAAAVAIPSFIKYTRRAKTTEAIDQLDKIYKSSAHYYTAPRVEAGTGNKIVCQFPQSNALTPARTNKSCCGGKRDTDDDNRCDVDTSLWTTPTWSALNFQMNDQHVFSYAYTSSGVGANAKFTASAHADLDCDGVFSTFERYGYGDPSSSFAECLMKGSSAFYKHNEAE